MSGIDEVALRLAFDRAALRALTGADRAEQLRFKPGTGLTAALLDVDGAPTGWLRVLAEGGQKLANARRRAERRGLRIDAAELDGALAFWGPIMADPGLDRALGDVGAELASSWAVLRYNPLRRLVVRAQVGEITAAGRLTHHRQDHLRAASRRITGRVPTLSRVRNSALPGSPRLTWWQWCEGGDLAVAPQSGTAPRGARTGEIAARLPPARQAGVITARLHRVAPPPLRDVHDQAAAQLAANVALLRALDPELGTGLGAVVDALLPNLRGGPAVTCHGDLSADQFLLTGDEVLLGDLDRVTAGPAASDLGSFAATSPDLLGDFLEGYRSTFGRDRAGSRPDHSGSGAHRSSTGPDQPAIAAWTAYAHAIRSTDPFRSADPDWRDQIAQHIRRIEETLWNRS